MRKRFLIVEDDALSRRILEDFFTEFADCDSAEDGVAGFTMFEKAILEGRPYQLVCTDIIMPRMDGHGLIGKIRACEQSLPIQDVMRTVIFAISASDTAKDMEQALLDCDGDDYIVKPFRPETLKNILRKYNLIDYDTTP